MRASWRTSVVLGLGLTALAAGACNDQSSTGGAGTNNGGSVVLDMSLAPPNARCAVITVTPMTGTAVTDSITLAPETETVFTLNNLPIGTVTVSEQVFTVACNATTGATPAWIAQAETISIQPGEPVTVALTLVPNATGGQVTLQNTFVTPTPVLQLFPVVPGSHATVTAITPGPDGAVWFLAVAQKIPGTDTFAVFRIGTSGLISEFDPPDEEKGFDITAGPDGNLWYTALTVGGGTSFVARLTPDGTFTFFDLPLDASGNELRPSGITVGTDGNIWFTETLDNQIGRMTVTGNLTFFPITTGTTGVGSIAGGSDGNLWFTESTPSRIGRMSKTGSLVEFSTPTALSGPQSITAGPDGNVWFIENAVDKIGRISPAGSIAEFSMPTTGGLLESITAGPDGNMWFTDRATDSVGQITTALGTITEFPIEGVARLNLITAGSDGNFWLDASDSILKFHP